MSRFRTVACGILVWATLPSIVRADAFTITSADPDTSWTYYVTGSDNAGFRSALANYFSRISPPATTPPPAPVATPPPPTPTSAPVQSTQPVLGSVSSAPVSAPMSTQAVSPTVQSASQTYDAFINMGNSNFPELSQLTTGNPQAWYLSPSVTKVFGNAPPTADQPAAFSNEVLQDVQKTFQLAGLNPKITNDPTAAANHTISVVSGVSYGPNPNAIGITDVGNNGFGFIDKLSYASTPDELALAVAHNVSHELMHAFGIANHPDQTGTYIDAGTATWSLLTSPATTFSPDAASLIQNALNTQVASTGVLGKQSMQIDGDQEILNPVPEPATVLGWSLVAAGALYHRRKKATRLAA
jgi:hypothetical protein